MDSIYLYDKYGEPISHDLWGNLVRFIDWVCQHWREPDEGIWEVRGGRQEFLYSRVLCWAAIDRAIRLARKRSLPAPLARWHEVRDAIYQDIFTHFWDAERQAFVQAKGATGLDASALLMPLMRFIAPTDPRWLSTLRAIERELVSDSLVYRYRIGDEFSDGLVRRRGDVQHVLVLVRRVPVAAGRPPAGALLLREDARLREPPRPLRRGARPPRRAPRQLPAGVHPPGADQRRLRSRPAPLGRGSPGMSRWPPVSVTPAQTIEREQGVVMAALLGMVTGIGGGMVRDLLVTEIPAVRRAELYAVAALAGAVVVAAGHVLHLPPIATTIAGAGICFGLRLLALSRGWRLPIARLRE